MFSLFCFNCTLLMSGSRGDDQETPGGAQSVASEAGLLHRHLPGTLQTKSNGAPCVHVANASFDFWGANSVSGHQS